MIPLLAQLLHDDGMDIIYFWSSIVIVALPLIVFGALTWFVIKASLKRQQH
jgi:heme/copper-type cytochrome/quinol oxidase subunit 2